MSKSPLPEPAPDAPEDHGAVDHRGDHRDARRDESPLRLADTDDGSTEMVEPGAAGASGASGLSGASEADASSASGSGAAASAASPGASAAGMATGGFETMLGQLVIKAGLATAEEVEVCLAQRDQGGEGEAPRTLPELLVENECVTPRQLERLRRDLEAKKSPQKIPGYRILKRVGAGAMATVFKARQLSLDRPVAIKVLPRKFSDNEKFIRRFYKEGRAAAKLNHPNIVSAYDVGRAGEHHFFVMEYVDGETVFDRIVREKQVDEQKAIRIVKQVARALQHAHDRGFVHRDIKPKNIMISGDGTVKLADLGLARAMSDKEAAKSEVGRAYGTPYYISPEQIRGELKIGPPADIYGLGATFYHMVTGKVPFDGKNPSAVMHRHLKEPLVPPDHVNHQLSSGCAEVIEKMMAKNAEDRYHSAGDLLEDLDLVAEGKSPHFAHSSLDLSSIGPAMTAPADRPTVVELPPRSGPSFTDSPLSMIMLVGLILSVVFNLVLLALVLMG